MPIWPILPNEAIFEPLAKSTATFLINQSLKPSPPGPDQVRLETGMPLEKHYKVSAMQPDPSDLNPANIQRQEIHEYQNRLLKSSASSEIFKIWKIRQIRNTGLGG